MYEKSRDPSQTSISETVRQMQTKLEIQVGNRVSVVDANSMLRLHPAMPKCPKYLVSSEMTKTCKEKDHEDRYRDAHIFKVCTGANLY